MTSDWQSAYWRDKKFPSDLVHNGHCRIPGRRQERSDLRHAVRHLRKVAQPTVAHVVTIVRLHRVSAGA